jgi:predicted nucleic acid-binding Zn ribbon protein
MAKRKTHSSVSGMAKIGDLMPQLIVRYGLHRRRNIERIEEAWRQVVGKPYAAVTAVSDFTRGILTVTVPHNAFVQEFSFRQKEFLAAFAAQIQDEKIKKIRFVVK